MLYIFAGLPGVGKTAIARKVAPKLSATVFNEDEILYQLFPKPKYTRIERDRVYEELFRKAGQALSENLDVILDATFIFKKHRKRAKNLARKYDTHSLLIEVWADEDLARKRLEQRQDNVTLEVYLKYKRNQEPIEEEHVMIENNGVLEEAVLALLEAV